MPSVIERVKRLNERQLKLRHVVDRDPCATVQRLQGFRNAIAVDTLDGELRLDGHQQALQPPCLDSAPIVLYRLESVLGAFSLKEAIDDLDCLRLRQLPCPRLYGTPITPSHARFLPVEQTPRRSTERCAGEEPNLLFQTARRGNGRDVRGARVLIEELEEPSNEVIALAIGIRVHRQTSPQNIGAGVPVGRTGRGVIADPPGITVRQECESAIETLRRPDLRHRLCAKSPDALRLPAQIRGRVFTVISQVSHVSHPRVSENPRMAKNRVARSEDLTDCVRPVSLVGIQVAQPSPPREYRPTNPLAQLGLGLLVGLRSRPRLNAVPGPRSLVFGHAPEKLHQVAEHLLVMSRPTDREIKHLADKLVPFVLRYVPAGCGCIVPPPRSRVEGRVREAPQTDGCRFANRRRESDGKASQAPPFGRAMVPRSAVPMNRRLQGDCLLAY